MKHNNAYKGYEIVHQFPGQWEITIWEKDECPCVHLFPSLKTAKAYIDQIREEALPD